MPSMSKPVTPDDLVAIDIHTHVLKSVRGHDDVADPATDFLAGVFDSHLDMTLPEMVAYYRQRRMAFVVFSIDDPYRSSRPPAVSAEEIAEVAAAHPDVVLPFASVDPHRGAEGVRMARRLITEHGVRGFKFHPSQQAFFPNDRQWYPLYEVIAEHRLPALFHSGQTAVGRGLPGGGGIRLKYSNPMFLDDVAVDFPDLPIILEHPSFPWQEEAIAVALHKPQVYIDLSGWSPKYFPPVLVQHLNTLLREKMLFGSDFPALTPDRWIAEFDRLAIKPEVRSLILRDNARRILGWPAPADPAPARS